MHRGRPVGESFDHCPAGWIRQSRKCCTKIIHNRMVVDYRSMSTANFAIRGFCPNVLALKAVLMILDLPGPQRRIANRQRAHRHRLRPPAFSESSSPSHASRKSISPTSQLLVSESVQRSHSADNFVTPSYLTNSMNSHATKIRMVPYLAALSPYWRFVRSRELLSHPSRN